MELKSKGSNVKLNNTQLVCLDSNGEADYEVFEACWEEYLSFISVDHLCLIFQAYGLIYPVKHSAYISSNYYIIRWIVQAYRLIYPVKPRNNYIIPCKLPEDIDKNSDVYEGSSWTIFYFDFFKFLPNEIYYQLICLALSKCEAEDPRAHSKYSKRKCFFVNLKGTNWIIELEQENQRLKFKVM